MNSLSLLLFHAETASLLLLHGLLRIAVITLGMAMGGIVLLLFWSAGGISAWLEVLTEHGSAGRTQGIKGVR
jgi:hypothetical protein